MGETFADTVLSGSLLIAVPVAAIAGLVSFLSPCVLPLVPGYLSYVTGLSGIELADGRRSRVVLGALLFVLGFSVVFVSYGALFGGLGSVLREYADPITRVMGVVLIVLGLVFAGWLPGVPTAPVAARHRSSTCWGSAGRRTIRHRLDSVHRPYACGSPSPGVRRR